MPQFTSALSLTEATAQIRSLEDDKKFVVTEPQPDGSVTFEVTQDIPGGGSVEVAGTLRAVAGGVAVTVEKKARGTGGFTLSSVFSMRNLSTLLMIVFFAIVIRSTAGDGLSGVARLSGPITFFVGIVVLNVFIRMMAQRRGNFGLGTGNALIDEVQEVLK